MLTFSGSLRIFIALEPCDMRKGFEGLAALASQRLNEDLRSGALFVFTNRRRVRLKVLFWDGSGLWLMTKRLEKGTFSWPRPSQPGQAKLQLAPEAFALLTDGIDLHGAAPRAWYERQGRGGSAPRTGAAKPSMSTPAPPKNEPTENVAGGNPPSIL